MARKTKSKSSPRTSGVRRPSLSIAPASLSTVDNPCEFTKPKTSSSKGKPKSAAPCYREERFKPSSYMCRPKFAAPSYMDAMDLPPSDDDEEETCQTAIQDNRATKANLSTIGVPSDRDLKKIEKRSHKMAAAVAIVAARQEEVLNEDRFTVVSGSRVSADGEAGDNNSSMDNVRDIVVHKFSVSAPGRELFKNASLCISHGRRYGLLGPNGTGKSTLLKLLAWRKFPVPRNIDMLLVDQEMQGDYDSVLEAVIAAHEELKNLRFEAETLSKAGNDGRGDLGEVYEKLELLGSDAAEAKASKILAGLGFTKQMQAKSTTHLSGGWRMRVSLARALFVQPTLLLLDEPTNHLDLHAVLWLEEYLLCKFKKTLVVVSHDRDFLNTVCTDIIHLHEFELHAYRGNMDHFETLFEQEKTVRTKKFESFDKQMKAAKRRGSKADQDKVIRQVLSKEAANGKGKGKTSRDGDDDDGQARPQLPSRWRDYVVKFHFPKPTELTPPLLQLIDVGYSYGTAGFKLSNVDAAIDMGTRVAIVGPNGAGKSTLLNLLDGKLIPTEGELRRSHKLRIGRYSQHFVDSLGDTMQSKDPVSYLLKKHPDQEGMSKSEAVRAKLGKFGLPSANHLTPFKDLSGGQKARVVFTSISMSNPHILLLDEPTNHLDMQSIDALAEALDEFTGGVVLVSHDSRLISRVCQDEEKSEIWVVENGRVTKYPCCFEEYKQDLMKEMKARAAE